MKEVFPQQSSVLTQFVCSAQPPICWRFGIAIPFVPDPSRKKCRLNSCLNPVPHLDADPDPSFQIKVLQ
jgi:hypothetical protein